MSITPWRRGRRAADRTSRAEATRLEAEMRRELAVLDLRTWILDMIDFHDWDARREFRIVDSDEVALLEATQEGRLGRTDAGTLRITSRRLTFAGSLVVRTVELRQIVAWRHAADSLSICAPHDDRVWHLTGLTEAEALLGAVTLNMADNLLDDECPHLDLAGSDAVATYRSAFEAAEVSPHRASLSQIAMSLDRIQYDATSH